MPPYSSDGTVRASRTSADTSMPISHPMDIDAPTPAKRNVIPKSVGNFDLVVEEKLDFADVTVAKWVSSVTGLKVVWADVEGPLVHGYFSVATEIFDDSGRPHTLEHLIFLGSEQYKYKGVLDTLANRMFANGTNAWTSTTDTTYTVGTAGAEGFLGILPVFVDHILYPTITDAGFVTEVHNINGKGEDSGVVYSEMQGRENGEGDLMQLRLQRAIYGKESAFRSETGGLMEALRKLKVEEIREYHASAYLPHNLTLIVTGRSLSPTQLLTTLSTEVEPSLIRHKQNQGPKPPGWIRPFVESSTARNLPKIDADQTETVEFPEKDESVGSVHVTWIGPRQKEFLLHEALDVLGEYLTDSPVSPLYQEFVELEAPACTDISFYSATQDPSTITVYISSVPVAKLDTLDSEIKAALARIAKEGIDMTRMQSILETQRLETLETMEKDASDALSTSILTDSLFGAENGSDLGPSLALYNSVLAGWTSSQWVEVLNKFYVNSHSITIIGRPSAALADKIEADDKARVAATVERLGPAGLAECANKVSKAQQENDRDIPSEIIKAFKVPDVNAIEWIEVDTARSVGVAKSEPTFDNAVQRHVDADGELPLFVQFDHIKSAFIEITVVLFIDATVETSTRALLPVYLDSFFSLPVTRADGTVLEYEEVVKALERETLSYSIESGRSVQEGITLKMKVVKEKYPVAIGWLNDLIWGSSFLPDRLKISAVKAVQDLPSEKRDGSSVSHAAYRQLVTSESSTSVSMNLLNRCDSLPAFLAQAKDDPAATTAQLEALRQGITDPKAMRISVKGDILSLPHPSSPWLTHFKQFPRFEKSELVPVVLGHQALNSVGQAPSRQAVIFGISSIESSFAYHVAKGPQGWLHPDQPALTVARSVLNAMEGFLWKWIRGAGLAYGVSIDQDMECGFVYYNVYKSPDSHAAFIAAQKLIDKIVSGEIEIDELTVESAKSSLAYSTAARESTMNDAAAASFSQQALLGLPKGHGRIALARTKDVSIPDILRVIQTWIQPIFHPSTSVVSIAMGTAKIDETVKQFEDLGYHVERRTFGDADQDSEDGSESGSESE